MTHFNFETEDIIKIRVGTADHESETPPLRDIVHKIQYLFFNFIFMYFRLRLSFKATDNLSVGREVLGSQRHNRCEDLLV